MDLSNPPHGLPSTTAVAEADAMPVGAPPAGAGSRRLRLVTTVVAALATVATLALVDRVRAPRAAAVAALVETSLQVERYFERCGRYPIDMPALVAGSVAGLCARGGVGGGGTGVTVADERYRIELRSPRDGGGRDSWLLAAEPLGRQAADRCGTFTLDELGHYDNLRASLAVSACWRR